MPVWKYRDISEMLAPSRPTRDEDLVRRLRALWRRTANFAPIGYLPGVYKFRTIEEAQAARDRNRGKQTRRQV